MVGEVADVVGVRELDVEGDSEVAFVGLLVGVVIAVAVVADIGACSHPACECMTIVLKEYSL